MTQKSNRLWAVIALLTLPLIAGCASLTPTPTFDPPPDGQYNAVVSASYSEPAPLIPESILASKPLDIDLSQREAWLITLEDAFQIALANSPVLRDLGSRIVQAPELARTIYGPSIQVTDPRFGIEAALSEFDAQFATRAFFDKNDRVLNNELVAGGVNQFRQDLWRFGAEISKKAATGTQLALRHNIEDNLNNATRNLFPRAQDWNLEAEVRQPLLQGGGALFNRIAGRSKIPGISNGVLIARTDSEISAGEFKLALRDFVSNVENAYWDLDFAYRDLDVKKQARDRTHGTWQNLKNRQDVEKDKVQQALEQYYRFQQDVKNSLNGRLVQQTRAFNGSGGGTFQGSGGVFVAERRLRLIMGLPFNDGRLIQPNTEPPTAPLSFDQEHILTRALASRGELAVQRRRIQRQELQLLANENYLKPTLDVVGRYRFRGLGNHLYDPVAPISPTINDSSTRHEWQAGFEFSFPFGFRQAHAAVRNSQLRLARTRAVLDEMERQVVYDLGNALADMNRAYGVIEIAYNRRAAALERYALLSGEDPAVRRAKPRDFNLILDAERRLSESETAYFRTRVDYALAMKNLHFEMGSLLEYCNVHLADG